MQYNRLMQNIYQAKGKTLAEQYRDVGRLLAKQVKKSVTKVAQKDSFLIKKRKLIAERVLTNLEHNLITKEFVECLHAWAEGAGITPVQAMWLMADNFSGCQTMIVRYKSGVALLHTEEDFEDIKARFTTPQTIEFRVNGESEKCLVYNDIMPGAALYGWKKDLLIAVDALFLREDGIEKVEKPMLANIISWLMWRMSPSELEPKRVIERLSQIGELVDGYAINVVRRVGKRMTGYKLTFVRHDYEIEKLGRSDGDILRQVNIIEPRYVGENRLIVQWQMPREKIEDYSAFIERLEFMRKLMQEYDPWLHQVLETEDLVRVHQAVMRVIFEKHKEEFVNEWMGAACVGLIDQRGTSVSLKLNDNRDVSVLEYVDRL